MGGVLAVTEDERPQQLSLDGDFTPPSQPDEDSPRASRAAGSREDPTRLRSAYGIEPIISAEAAVVMVDRDHKVVEHHIGWLAACAEHRSIQAVERDYDSIGRHEAAAREAETASKLAGHARELIEMSAVEAQQANVSVREIGRRLHKSPSHITRILQRVALREEHPDLADRLTDSHLEAVATCDREQQRQLLEQAVADHLSVHELEHLVRDVRIAFRRIVGGDQRCLSALEASHLARLVPDWQDRAPEWVAWFKVANRVYEPGSDSLPRGNKRHGRAA